MAGENDNILDDVRAAAAELEGGNAPDAGKGPVEAPAGDPAPGTDPAQPAADRPRDEAGRFAKAPEGKPRETLTLKEKAPKDGIPPRGTPPTPDQLASTAAKPSEAAAPAPLIEQALAAPLHWKGGQKIQWARLPKDVQQGILDDHKALQEQQAAYEPLNKALEPYREVFVRDAGSIEAAVSQLGQFYRAYLDNPVGLIQHIARTRGIDLGQPQGQPVQPGTPPPAPDINSVVTQAVQQAIRPFQEQIQQTETQQIQQTVQEFASDPAHPYFQDVRVHMGHLLNSGQAKSMKEAYDQAIWANPVIRQQLLTEQAEEARKAQAAEAEKARKAAAASVRGSPIPGALNGTGNPKSSVHDDVRAAWAEVVGQ